jgi:hypothetical protein
MNKNELKCLSCDKIIKSKNLKKHSETKTHLKNVNKKVSVFMTRIKNKKNANNDR